MGKQGTCVIVDRWTSRPVDRATGKRRQVDREADRMEVSGTGKQNDRWTGRKGYGDTD